MASEEHIFPHLDCFFCIYPQIYLLYTHHVPPPGGGAISILLLYKLQKILSHIFPARFFLAGKFPGQKSPGQICLGFAVTLPPAAKVQEKMTLKSNDEKVCSLSKIIQKDKVVGHNKN